MDYLVAFLFARIVCRPVTRRYMPLWGTITPVSYAHWFNTTANSTHRTTYG